MKVKKTKHWKPLHEQKTASIIVRIRPVVKAKLKRIAGVHKATLSQLVLWSLEQYL